MTAADYLRMSITTAGQAGTAPESLPGVARYLEDGWKIVGVRFHGADIAVDIIKDPGQNGPTEVPLG